jgi:muconolactone delta-isomerase
MQYLVITKDDELVDWDSKTDLLEKEATLIWNIYKSGILRNIWFTENTKEAILLFECEQEADVEKIMNSLPLVINRLITYSITGLIAYTGIERLFNGTSK